jgi:processive 1,2-diacylglycerol beta-glucosyltransferase
MPRRVLVVSVSAGAGHLRAAQAVTEALAAAHPDVTVKNIDCMDYCLGLFRHAYSGLYLRMADRAPWLWRYVYRKSARQQPSDWMARLERWIERQSCGKLVRLAAEFAPDEILCVHPLPLHVFLALKRRGKLSARISVATTDFDLHPLWTGPGVDRYFASCEEIAHYLERAGAEPKAITVTGIPIVPVFAQPVPPAERARLRKEFMLADGRPTVLASAGGFGVGRVARAIRTVMNAAHRAGGADVLVVAGRNEKLRAEIHGLAAPAGVRLCVFGFVTNMHELTAAADLIVTKPGGLTASECLARALPMILLDPIPGQEESNATYLLEHGAAWQARDLAMLDYKVGRLLAQPEQLAAMRKAAEKLARPRAAFDIAKILATG